MWLVGVHNYTLLTFIYIWNLQEHFDEFFKGLEIFIGDFTILFSNEYWKSKRERKRMSGEKEKRRRGRARVTYLWGSMLLYQWWEIWVLLICPLARRECLSVLPDCCTPKNIPSLAGLYIFMELFSHILTCIHNTFHFLFSRFG